MFKKIFILLAFFSFGNQLIAQKVPTESKTSSADEIINFAKKFLGVPYVYGGASPAGFDCSGFIQYVFKEFGYSLGRTAGDQSIFGFDVQISELQPGDLLYFKGRNLNSSVIGHVAMVTSVTDGRIEFIHAAGKSIRMDVLNNSSYYVPRFIKARRGLQ
ncbi:MAG: C40 family peptidase [Bacteroidota bacterium]